MTRLCLSILLLSAFVFPLLAGERFPPPELGPGYEAPALTTPLPLPPWRDLLDVGLLAGALGLAAYLVLKARWRRGVFGLMLLALLYFGFVRRGCVCPVGSLQNVARALGDASFALPAVVGLFFLLPLLATLLFGRVFCGAVCPLGAMQDAVLVKPLKVPRALDEALRCLPVIYLGLAVLYAACGGAFLICAYDPFVGFFRLQGATLMLILGGCVVALSTLIGRPYCRYACAYGVGLGWLGMLSRRRVSIAPDDCVPCRLCEDACPFGAILPPTPEHAEADRGRGRTRLLLSLLALPVLTGLLAWGGRALGPTLAGSHPTVELARMLRAEAEAPPADDTFAADRLAAYRLQLLEAQSVEAEAEAARARFAYGGLLLGAFLGLVFGLRLIGYSLRRKQRDYVPDRERCFACGRCYAACPRDRSARGDPQEAPARE